MPGINKADKIMLTINLTALFNGVAERTHVWGKIVPEEGAPGIFGFRTPSGYTDIIIDLQ
jgi:flagellin FlaB